MKMKKSKVKLNAVVGLEHIKDHRDSGINEAKRVVLKISCNVR